jgi:MtrB/PioB family decaheme-associated outer membrane protein
MMRLTCVLAAIILFTGDASARAQGVVSQLLPDDVVASPSQAPAGRAEAAAESSGGEFGGRLTSIAGDPGRFQRYRDLRSGPTLDRVRYRRTRDAWLFGVEADHTGYRDQRYLVRVERPGRFGASFEWDQVPLFYTDITQSPFTEADAVFALADAGQFAVQNGSTTAGVFSGDLRRFDTRSRRDTAALKLSYVVTRDIDLHLGLTSTARHGEQQWAASFGFSNADEVALPVRHRTNDLKAAAEWSGSRGMVRLGYDGSWFDNDVETLIWDNPLRLTDQTHPNAYSTGDGSSRGRMTVWPDSSAHTVSLSGSLPLPARSRAFAFASVGSWLQDQALLPHTINSAITPIALPRDTAAAEARITSMSYRVTSRPMQSLWLSAQYRLYDYDNRTPHFAVDQYVRLDGNVASSVTGGSEPFGYTRHFTDVDASFTPFRFAALRVGYGREEDHRTFRFLDETTEQTVRASVDSTGFAWGWLRLQYDHAVRTGEGLDEQAFSDIGEQVSLRQFDISDRARDRVTAIVQMVPAASIGVSLSVTLGQEDRPDTAFGLQDNDLRAYTLAVDVVPGDRIGGGLSYGFENYRTRQQSRQANPGAQFNDPTRDWWTDMDEDVHTVSASIAAPRLARRTALNLGYDFVGSRAAYVYSIRPDSTLATPQQLAPVRNELQRATLDLRYMLTSSLSLGAAYWFDTYDVDDFAVSPGTLNSPLLPTFLNVGYQWRPYDAHTGLLRLLYAW